MKTVYTSLAIGLLSLGLGLTHAQAACDPTASAVQFQTAMQEAAQKNPSKISAIQADLQTLSTDMNKLISEGKTEEVCARYDAMTAKLK